MMKGTDHIASCERAPRTYESSKTSPPPCSALSLSPFASPPMDTEIHAMPMTGIRHMDRSLGRGH